MAIFTDIKKSYLKCVPYGVTQWSGVPPVPFLIYNNDIPKSLDCAKCVLYADDTTSLVESKIISVLYTLEIELLLRKMSGSLLIG